MAAVNSSTTTSPAIFKDLSSSVTAIIAEIEAKECDGPNDIVIVATQLLIAIENAANIFKAYVALNIAYALSPLDQKAKEFKQMIACLKKVDYCRLNLPIWIRHSIDSGTSYFQLPKLYAVNPQYVVPIKAGTTVQFFGRFKYADVEAHFHKRYLPTLQVGEQTFKPTQCDEHALTFEVTFDPEKTPFKDKKFSQFDGRLVVPYSSEGLSPVPQLQTFEFNVPIRALPIVAGIITVDRKAYVVEWGAKKIFTLMSNSASSLTFISFDKKTQEFTAAQLETEAAKVAPKPLIVEGSYLKISQVAVVGDDKHKWEVETVPPVGL